MERNQTVFPSYFVEAFAEDKADADKDQRVSVLEAFVYARREVERFYEKGRLLATEHADPRRQRRRRGHGGAGRYRGPATGRWRARCSSAAARRQRGGRRRGRRRSARGRAAPAAARPSSRRSAALKARKDEMTPEQYDDELETLLLELARSDAALRGARGIRR